MFFGILVVSGYNRFPSKRSYWDYWGDMANDIIKNTMRRNRIAQIIRFSHFVDNANLENNLKIVCLRNFRKM